MIEFSPPKNPLPKEAESAAGRKGGGRSASRVKSGKKERGADLRKKVFCVEKPRTRGATQSKKGLAKKRG